MKAVTSDPYQSADTHHSPAQNNRALARDPYSSVESSPRHPGFRMIGAANQPSVSGKDRPINFRFALSVLASIVLLVQFPTWAAPAGEHWEAFSRTATDVTRDISISPDRITFGNGASLPLASVGSVPVFKEEGKTVNATSSG